MDRLDPAGCNNATMYGGSRFTGNIIPNNWYKKITTNSGRPDLASITILAEVVYWYRPNRDGGNKFNGDLWQSSYEYFENKFGYNRQKIRRIFVRLEELGLVKRQFRTIKHRGQKYNNILFLNLLDLSLLSPKPIVTGTQEDKKISSKLIKNDTPSLQNCSNHIIDKKNKVRNRSSFSSKKFEDFYPLSETELDKINFLSGRNFNLNAMNEILSSMAKKLPNHSFASKKAFLNYMSKAISAELRQAELVNNSEFKINLNKSPDEQVIHKYEKFLEKVESSRDSSLQATLRKKIAAIYEPEKSYEILTKLRFIEDREGQIRLIFQNNMDFSRRDLAILRTEIKSIVGEKKLEIVEVGRKIQSIPPKREENNLWSDVRKAAKNIFGEGVDQSWFSRISPIIDEDEKKISLKADTDFIRNWMENNYMHFLTNQLADKGFTFNGLC